MELQMEFQATDLSICNGNKKYLIGTSIFTWIFAFKLFHVFIAVASSLSSKYYLQFLTNYFTTSLQNLNKIGWSERHKIWIFLTTTTTTKPGYYVNQFYYIVNAILKEVLPVKQISMLRVFSTKLPSIIFQELR